VEQTLVIIKPDGVQRGLIGPIITRLERRGLRLVALKLMQISKELASRHYAIHQGKPFYEPLLEYVTSFARHWGPPGRPRRNPVPSGAISG